MAASDVKIQRLVSVEEHLDELTELLVQVVEDGASVGFLPPLAAKEAADYWRGVPDPDVLLFVAKRERKIIGTVQLQLTSKPNGLHRAEIAKLMTHPEHRRLGAARLLMQAAEEAAKQENRSLLVLDTREGDPSNLLYASLGYMQAGRIPNYARSANGVLHATIYYFKCI
jgi:ribosomal protein S18 acetylase RimI-like enzyme